MNQVAMDEKIIYSRHAEEKIKERRIDKEIVESTLLDPEEIIHSRDNIKIAYKIVGNKLLRVIFKEEKDIWIIITAYLTKKNRYEVNK